MRLLNPSEINAARTETALALAAARADDWEGAARHVQSLRDRYPGGEGIQVFLLGLADTLIIRQGLADERAGNDAIQLVWINPASGALENAQEVVRPEIRWAGWFIAARAGRDNEQCCALVNGVQGEEFGRNVFAVLEVVAYTLNVMGAP